MVVWASCMESVFLTSLVELNGYSSLSLYAVSLVLYAQSATQVMTPASMYFLWKQGSWFLWPTVHLAQWWSLAPPVENWTWPTRGTLLWTFTTNLTWQVGWVLLATVVPSGGECHYLWNAPCKSILIRFLVRSTGISFKKEPIYDVKFLVHWILSESAWENSFG